MGTLTHLQDDISYRFWFSVIFQSQGSLSWTEEKSVCFVMKPLLLLAVIKIRLTLKMQRNKKDSRVIKPPTLERLSNLLEKFFFFNYSFN